MLDMCRGVAWRHRRPPIDSWEGYIDMSDTTPPSPRFPSSPRKRPRARRRAACRGDPPGVRPRERPRRHGRSHLARRPGRRHRARILLRAVRRLVPHIHHAAAGERLLHRRAHRDRDRVPRLLRDRPDQRDPPCGFNPPAGVSLLVATLILVPIATFLAIIVLRFVIEAVVALIAIAENTERTAQHTAEVSQSRTGESSPAPPRPRLAGLRHPPTARSRAGADSRSGRASSRTRAPLACLLKWLRARTAPPSLRDDTHVHRRHVRGIGPSAA